MTGTDTNSLLSMILPIALIFGAMYFFMIRPQKKKEREEAVMRNSIEPGDEITTIGGIVGKVVSVKEDDDTFILQTSSDKTKIRLHKWAIRSRDVAVDEE